MQQTLDQLHKLQWKPPSNRARLRLRRCFSIPSANLLSTLQGYAVLTLPVRVDAHSICVCWHCWIDKDKEHAILWLQATGAQATSCARLYSLYCSFNMPLWASASKEVRGIMPDPELSECKANNLCTIAPLHTQACQSGHIWGTCC